MKSAMVNGEPSLLVGDVVVRHPHLAGLDSVGELFAVDAPDINEREPAWGSFWAVPFGAAPPLPASCRSGLPDEGGFLLRPLALSGTEKAQLLAPNDSRRLVAPSRHAHSDMGFPEPTLVSNDIFSEIRYSMAPSLVKWLDFDDIRDGTIRVFAAPDFEGDVRILTVVDEAAAAIVLAAATIPAGMQRKRLLQFLHAAAAAPPAARWPTTAEVTDGYTRDVSENNDGLFSHQAATIAWMRTVEAPCPSNCSVNARSVEVMPIMFAGVTLGSKYEVVLPHGGVIAHPPGSGKTRIVARLAALSERKHRLSTLIVCPAHLREQWVDELETAGVKQSSAILDYTSVGTDTTTMDLKDLTRLIIDEPQDCPAGEAWDSTLAFTDRCRTEGATIWELCGTAPSHLNTIGHLLLGRKEWHKACRQSEWRGIPQLSHIIRSCFISDPPWACLPMPELRVQDVPVVLRPRESADAAVASLAGFVLDGVMLLSFGAEAAFAAAQERDQLLLQMGWTGSIGTALLPATEHALAEWDGTVVQRSQQKLDDLCVEIAALEAEENKHVADFQFAAGDAAEAPDLSFLSREAARVEIDGLPQGPVAQEACTAEWNHLLLTEGNTTMTASGRLVSEAVGTDTWNGARIALVPSAVDGDFAAVTVAASADGASAVIFAARCDEQPRPFGYRHDQVPPGIPAAMVSAELADRLRVACTEGSVITARVHIAAQVDAEEEEDVDQGLVSAFVAADAVEDELHRRLKSLREEQQRCERSLRFARQMHTLLEQNEAHCPICFHSGTDAEAFAVMPDCFHILCHACLERQAGLEPSFQCPMCRIGVARLDVVVFRAPCTETRSEPPEEPKESKQPSPRTTEMIPSALDTGSGAWELLPSKIQRLVLLLRELLDSGIEERVLVYTQWVSHVSHLHELFSQHGIKALALAGELNETMDALRRFGRPGEPRVLLLSSQRHSSGINLQAARHLVVVHPYCTPTASCQESISRAQMLSFEAQAIGRIRRYPQRCPVHVYRFFAAGSVEEGLYIGR